jgi:hypothetical protein
MKLLVSIVLLSLGVSFQANAWDITLERIVVAVDETESRPYYAFPCTEFVGVVSCGRRDLILDPRCEATLKIDGTVISCEAADGLRVEIGRFDENSRYADNTSPGTYSYRVNYADRVKLQKFTTPNGNSEYQLKVLSADGSCDGLML